MKRTWIFILAMLMLVGTMMTACGSSIDYSKRQFDGHLKGEFSWSMTRAEAKAYIEEYSYFLPSPVKNETLTVANDEYVFRYDGDKLVFIKIILKDQSHADLWMYRLGREDKYETDPWPSWNWYGTLDGRNTRVNLSRYGDSDGPYYLQFALADSGY